MEPAPAPQVMRFSELTPVPWRNGGGVTREVVRRPDPQRPGFFLWRVSVADIVDDAPFSAFPGVRRLTVLVDDAIVDLIVEGASTRLTRFVPFGYPGEASTAVHPGSTPVRLLNVMTGHTPAAADVQVVRGGSIEVRSAGSTQVLVVLDGVGTLRWGSDASLLGVLDTVVAPGPAPATLDLSAGVAAVIRFA